ncbi:unnamed protein product [Hyaloperonospora brassicae]|uniref:RxLR effector protein n=1 Tax=Hyaloperonospora brassicae TaxID=162125 RepID=A0AAV0U3Y3_HYABA|nr:unnamed protein product [Hyaloperonospora brassicae]
MHFRVLLVLAVATFVASCSSFASADTRSTKGVDDDSSAIGRLRGEGAMQMEDKQLDFRPSEMDSELTEQAVPEAAPAGRDAGRVPLTDAQKAKLMKKIRAFAKDDEARAMSFENILLWSGLAGVIAGSGWFASSLFKAKGPYTNGLPLATKAPGSS